MISRRDLLTSAFKAAGAAGLGLVVPEWILDPPRGRSQIAVPALPGRGLQEAFVIEVENDLFLEVKGFQEATLVVTYFNQDGKAIQERHAFEAHGRTFVLKEPVRSLLYASAEVVVDNPDHRAGYIHIGSVPGREAHQAFPSLAEGARELLGGV